MEKMLRLQQVLELVGMKKSKWYNLVKEKIAPAPVNFYGVSVWPEGDIIEFVERSIGRKLKKIEGATEFGV